MGELAAEVSRKATAAKLAWLLGASTLAGIVAWVGFLHDRSIEPKAPASLQLERAFRTCVDLQHVELANLLLRSVWDPPARAQMSSRHDLGVASFSITAEEQGIATASVKLKPHFTVMGVVPLELSASTCPDGCGLAHYKLDLGRLHASDRQVLDGWVRAAPGTPWESSGATIKVQLMNLSDGRTALVCDISS